LSLPPDFMLQEFHSQENTYLYCGKTHQIFCVDPVMIEIIALYNQCSLADIQQQLGQAFGLEEITENYQVVHRLAQEHGFFRCNGLRKRASTRSEEQIIAELAQGIQQLCLEVTEGCNLRCHYCAYSGGYVYNRQHGSRAMPRDVAQAAIDLLFQKNRDREEHFALSFYGGEPLLQLALIQFCIEYARSLPWRNPEGLSFNMTTNGTLLDDDTIRFLVDNEVGLLVSLDGPAEDHDAHRLYAHGGGTFEKIIDNLRRFNDIAPEYLALSANCVITPTADLLRLNDFFVQRRDLFRSVMVTNVSTGHQSFFDDYPGDPERQNQQLDMLCQQYIEAHWQPGPPIAERPEMIFIQPLFERDFVTLHRRHILSHVPDEFNVISTCFPGKRKAFVDVDGKLHICERIVNTCSIGDVWRGFDLAAIKKLFDEYVALMNRQECLNCWAFQLCPACFAMMAEDGRLSLERTQSLCASVKRNWARTLQTYCAILEKNPTAFDYMKDYKIE
jgi:uncharacterized protein